MCIFEELVSSISGSRQYIVVGNCHDDGDYYWPTVEDHDWVFKGTVVQLFKSEILNTLKRNNVRSIQILPSKTGPYFKILID